MHFHAKTANKRETLIHSDESNELHLQAVVRHTFRKLFMYDLHLLNELQYEYQSKGRKFGKLQKVDDGPTGWNHAGVLT